MWFFCPSARAAARRLIESSHDMIRPNIVLHCLTLTWRYLQIKKCKWAKVMFTRICLFWLSTIPSTQPSGIEKLLPRLRKESWASWAHASAWRREVGGLYRVLKTSSYWAPPTCATLAPLEEKLLPPKNLHQDWLRGSACETPTHVPIGTKAGCMCMPWILNL